MYFIKMMFVCSLIALVAAVPPKRFNSQRVFKSQRQVAAEEEEQSQGYNYEAPQGERLRLPSRQFARQEEQPEQSGGYHYPKPTNSYGPPAEEPSTEYGPPATEETTDNGETTTDSSEETTDEPSTEEPEFENIRSLQAQQYRRRNSKLMKSQKIQLIQTAQLQQPQVFIQYPTDQFLQQPQYFYVL